jgi:glycosyltransferase involved in cell wall biosynthesis
MSDPGSQGLTILTATFNCRRDLAALAQCIRVQTDHDHLWLIVDGMSTDGTLEAVPPDMPCRVEVIREPDFGIYDAINKGVRRITQGHYVVVGADDRPAQDMVERYRQQLRLGGHELVAAAVQEEDRIVLPGRGHPWRHGQNAYIAHHSLGVAIARSLHDRFGFYSRRFPIAADQLFVKSAMAGGASIRYCPEFVAGVFARGGVSSTDYFGALCEFTRVQLETERHPAAQLLLFVLRVLKNLPRMVSRP